MLRQNVVTPSVRYVVINRGCVVLPLSHRHMLNPNSYLASTHLQTCTPARLEQQPQDVRNRPEPRDERTRHAPPLRSVQAMLRFSIDRPMTNLEVVHVSTDIYLDVAADM